MSVLIGEGVDYQRLRNIMHFISLVIPLLLLSNEVAVHAAEKIPRWAVFELASSSRLLKNLEDPKRDQLMQPDRVIDAFGVKKGESIADVGAGTGYFSFRLAASVGVEGRIYAVEIEDDLLDFISKKMAANKVANIIPIKSSGSDPNLPPACCDKILVVNTYNFISDRITYLKNIRKALKPGGLVAIIDVDVTNFKSKNRVPLPGDVIEEMKRAGFVLRESHDFLASRFFLVFGASAI